MAGPQARALVLAPTVELAAALAEPFTHVRVVTSTTELDAALAADGPAPDVVAVTAVPPADLGRVAAALRVRGVHEMRLLVDLATTQDIRPELLAGFDSEGVVELAGGTYLALRTAADAHALPVLPGSEVAASETDIASRRSRAVADVLADRPTVDPSPHVTAVPPTPAAAVRPRVPRAAIAVGVALVVGLALCIVLALATDTGYTGAVTSLLVLLVAANLLYAWRTNRWRAAVDARVARDRSADAQLADAHLDAVLARLDDVERAAREVLLGLRVAALRRPRHDTRDTGP